MRFAAAVACLTSLASAQTTWYVDVHASGPGSGTSFDPYASLQYAHDQATTLPADTLLVAAGVYPEKLHVTKNVTIRSSAGPLATVIRPTGIGNTVDLDGDSNVFLGARLEGFTIFKTGSNESQAAVRGNNGLVRHCILVGNGTGYGALSDYDLGVEHCTVVGHRIGVTEAPFIGLVYVDSTIAYGDSENDVHFINGSYFTNSCYGHGIVNGGSGNVAGDPLLFALAEHDFHLSAGSPCIDSGTPTPPGDPFGPHDEIGALAYDASYAPFATYCTAKVNSLGCVPAMTATGTASATSGSRFWIDCYQELNHRLGLLFYGFAPKNTAYQGGYLCVQSPVHRTGLFSSGGNPGADDCSGAYSFDFNALVASGMDLGLAPGVEVFGQYWSRDPNASFTTNRSDAIRFRIAP